MTTTKRGEDAASHLQVVATSKLYLNNAFRVTGLGVTATLKEAKKYARDREQCHKLGVPWQYQSRPYFPVFRTHNIEDIRIAVDQLLTNPYRRIIEELFWFWPDPEGDPANAALNLLGQGDYRRAASAWVSQVNSLQANIIPMHNLAVLNHLLALELEQEIREGGCQNLVCPKCRAYFRITAAESGTIIACPNCLTRLKTRPLESLKPDLQLLSEFWRDALDYWSRLWISAAFWTELALRAQKLDEILGQEVINQVKNQLPEALLAVNVGLSVEYCERGNYPDAVRSAQIVFSSHFSEKHRYSAIRNVTAHLVTQVHEQANMAESNAKNRPESGVDEVLSLLDRTRPILKCFEILNCGSLNLGFAAGDAVANSALNALIEYEHKLHNCEPLLKPAEEIHKIAKSESVKERISTNLTIIRDKLRREAIESSIKPIIDLCGQLSHGISSLADSDRSMAYYYHRRFKDEVLPKLENIQIQFGELSGEYSAASDAVAFCLRGISVALHNNSQDLYLALETIQQAVKMSRDPELHNKLLEDLRICQMHASEKGRGGVTGHLSSAVKQAAAEHTVTRSALNLPTWVTSGLGTIGIIVLYILFAKNCTESPNSSHSPSASATGRTYYTPTNNSSSQETTPQFSLGSSQSQSTSPGQTYSGVPTGTPSRTSPSNYPSSSTPSRQPNNLTLLRQEIEADESRLDRMDKQYEDIKKQLEKYKLIMNSYELSNQIENYNSLVPIHNELVGKLKELANEYNSLLTEYKEKVILYNAGIR